MAGYVIISGSLGCCDHETEEFKILREVRKASNRSTDPRLQETKLHLIWGTGKWDPMADSSEGQRSSGGLAGL